MNSELAPDLLGSEEVESVDVLDSEFEVDPAEDAESEEESEELPQPAISSAASALRITKHLNIFIFLITISQY